MFLGSNGVINLENSTRENVINLPHRYTPRSYQVPILRALDSGIKRAVQVWHRRAGKEKTSLNLMIKKMLQRVGTYYYVFPEFAQGRKILWDGADKEGLRFLDHFPKELIEGKPNQTEMKIRLKNGSLFQIIGSDNYNAVMGTNPIGMVFSEYSLQDPLCWAYFRPILLENGGWAVFNFTPRGENHAYDLYELAKAFPDKWFSELLTVDDTKILNPEDLEQERKETIRLHGNDALHLQEFYCSFTAPISGAFYAHQVSKAYRDGRVGQVPYDPSLTVNTWWDLGLNDRTAIWFTQQVAQEIRVIDYEEGSDKGLVDYIPMLKEKPYIYQYHVAPFDINTREYTTGRKRIETAKDMGIDFSVAAKVGILDGIDAARNIFSNCYFDKEKCAMGLNALKSYRKEYDEKRKTYKNKPRHDWASNGADAFRYMAVSMDHKKRNKPAEAPDGYLRKREKFPGRDTPGSSGSPMSVFG